MSVRYAGPYIRYVGGPTYSNSLMIFTYNRGKLELSGYLNSAGQLVPSSSTTGTPPTFVMINAPSSTGAQVFRLGSESIVTNLGDQLVAYLKRVEGWEQTPGVSNGNYYKLTDNSQITIASNGIVTRVKILNTTNLPPISPAGNNNTSYKVSETFSNTINFQTNWSTFLFDQPLVLMATKARKYTSNNSPFENPPVDHTIYITLSTQWDH